ncbi:MAG: replication-associated recombination protein A [Gammaproteobacteria bacterium]|nr:replication-associated recombination protein A [Gammaproteobacteria bacterium]
MPSNSGVENLTPLADRMRPSSLDEIVGQQHLLGPGKPLRKAVESGHLHSMIFWGPPGSGKTTLARVIANHVDGEFISLSAVASGVKEIRQAAEVGQAARRLGRATVLFVDEVHRFNKTQQDGFLGHIEDGTLTLIGATTENPSFELNNALLSRVRIYVLEPLSTDELRQIVTRAVAALSGSVELDAQACTVLACAAQGDARSALNMLEVVAALSDGGPVHLDEHTLEQVIGHRLTRFDKTGDIFYDQISALHKSVRGSAPDAALYWLARMLEGGCDPRYILRRLVRIASEDIGNADPRALQIALDAWDGYVRLGSPEGDLAVAHATVYLACAPKSDAVYKAFTAANKDAREHGAEEVPKHLRNAPTELLRQLRHGHAYRHAHDEAEGYAAGEVYFPPTLLGRRYYHPVDRGLEQRIAARLEYLRKLDSEATNGAQKNLGGNSPSG